MPDHAVDNPEFYEAHWRRTRTAHDPAVLSKAAQLVELVPAGVRSVLDVGCGDGTITAAMAQRFEVTAVDHSAAALAHVAEHSPAIEQVRQHHGQRWHWWPGLQVQCPACGNEHSAAPKWHAGNRLVDISCDHATRLWARWTGAREQPYWITLLLRRRDRDG